MFFFPNVIEKKSDSPNLIPLTCAVIPDQHSQNGSWKCSKTDVFLDEIFLWTWRKQGNDFGERIYWEIGGETFEVGEHCKQIRTISPSSPRTPWEEEGKRGRLARLLLLSISIKSVSSCPVKWVYAFIWWIGISEWTSGLLGNVGSYSLELSSSEI